MNLLTVGTDRRLFENGSDVEARQMAYAKHFDRVDSIVFSTRAHQKPSLLQLSEHLYAHGTNSRSKLLYIFDAYRLASSLPKPDVVSAQDPFETGLVAHFIARRLGVPLHIQVHTDFLSPEYARTSLFNRVRVGLARHVLRHAKRIRVVSERIETSLESLKLTASISVLPIFVDVKTAQVGLSNSKLQKRFEKFTMRALVVARLEREKNVALALESFAKVAPNTGCLIVVGDGGEREWLRALAKRLEIEDRVFFEGYRPAAPYYAIADVVLVTSRYEGYGMAIVEALANGKPVISTDVGVAREAGATIADPAHFSEALQNWIENGPTDGVLKSYPYKSIEDYVDRLTADIQATP